VIATVLATITGAGGLGVTAAEAQPLQSHPPITITNGSQFDLAHGVTNGPFPSACGTAATPCSIDGWSIQPSAGQACITIDLTNSAAEPSYVIQNNRCSGGMDGIVLIDAPRGTVRNNTISGASGAANSPAATGIMLNTSDNMTITENRLSNIEGRPGMTFGQSGGDAVGIHVLDSDMVDIQHNDISLVAGGFGFLGALGGAGGNGGNGTAILAEQTMAPTPCFLSLCALLRSVSASLLRAVPAPLLGSVANALPPTHVVHLNLKNNTISRVYGAVGAVGGLGGVGPGGDGGDGGSATGVRVKGFSDGVRYRGVTVQGNSVSFVTGALGALGAAGWRGGRGGDGGSGQGVVLTDVASSATVTGNAIYQLYGAYGAAAGWGAYGGNGGNGGDGIGIRKGNVAVAPGDNIISFFFAGIGGAGGLPNGLLGSPGTAAAIV